MTEKKLDVLTQFRTEREMGYKNGLYRLIQIDFAYNSNRMEGSTLTEDDTRLIYETGKMIADKGDMINANDVIETVNHFRCFDYLLDVAEEKLSEVHIKEFHRILKRGSLDEDKPYFAVGDYKKQENIAGNIETTAPKDVPIAMSKLLDSFHHVSEEYQDRSDGEKLRGIIDFHVKFEKIHPFQDGNGRVGRLVMFKSCLENHIMPFVIEDKNRPYYLQGLINYQRNFDKIQLTETILQEQDIFTARYEKYAFLAAEVESKVGRDF